MTHPIPAPRRVWNAIVRYGRRLRPDRRGAVAVFLAFAIIPLIGIVGVATDTARAYLVKSRLSSALDAAGLAGGYSFFLNTRDADTPQQVFREIANHLSELRLSK